MIQATKAIVQARIGSTRLPGKVLFPLNCDHVLVHVVNRVAAADTIDDVIVATSTLKRDDVVARVADRAGATVHRGSETDVLGRMFEAATEAKADKVVRITADCPLVPPAVIDAVVEQLHSGSTDYVSNTVKRTFPRGFDVEAFTYESFEHVEAMSTIEAAREHVTVAYRERKEFDTDTIRSTEVFDDPSLHNRTDLRLTLDVGADYDLLSQVYGNVPFDGILPVKAAVRYVDDHGLAQLNDQVEQKSVGTE